MRRKRNARRERPGLFYARKARWPVIARDMEHMKRVIETERESLARIKGARKEGQ